MSNKERLEQKARECDASAAMWRWTARLARKSGHTETERHDFDMADSIEREAAWYRSLIPLVEAGERAPQAATILRRCADCIEYRGVDPHLAHDARVAASRILPAPPKEGA